MRHRIFWTGIVSVLVFNSAALLHAQEKTVKKINVFPPAVQLDSARDFQTIIVQAIREDSVTEDVTASAKMVFQDPECVVLERIDGDDATSIRLSPKQDGNTVLVVTYEGHQVELPVSVRSAKEKPPLSFRLDVMPVFARAGCNMGSCHGAARGKDGFRLSLFGFDPTGDYHRLTREMPGRRINLANPEGSLLVQKAVGAVPHTGGKRFEKDSELADRLVRWIAAGAKDDPNAGKDAPKLQAVDLYPPTSLLEGKQA
ncbi:MAG: cell surface protein, partial [Pirellulales bacterium]|nr:cell surface protein [Pirellulales bacterium]